MTQNTNMHDVLREKYIDRVEWDVRKIDVFHAQEIWSSLWKCSEEGGSVSIDA